ncbi:MAG: initiation control protein YabA [Syntrophomonadales bacterium]|jgi:regulator of replication initiation timing
MDENARETAQEVKIIVKELLNEVAELKERVMELERHLNIAPAPPPRRAPFVLGAESYENMGRLYAEGYHICPVAFGQVRDEGECLFCVNILESK